MRGGSLIAEVVEHFDKVDRGYMEFLVNARAIAEEVRRCYIDYLHTDPDKVLLEENQFDDKIIFLLTLLIKYQRSIDSKVVIRKVYFEFYIDKNNPVSVKFKNRYWSISELNDMFNSMQQEIYNLNNFHFRAPVIK